MARKANAPGANKVSKKAPTGFKNTKKVTKKSKNIPGA